MNWIINKLDACIDIQRVSDLFIASFVIALVAFGLIGLAWGVLYSLIELLVFFGMPNGAAVFVAGTALILGLIVAGELIIGKVYED